MEDNPIVFIDADEDDHDLLLRALAELKFTRPLVFFTRAQEALQYLRTTKQQPFIIISEISLPAMNGIELRQAIERDEALRKKSIPFVFLTAPIDDRLVDIVYELTIQGLFEKQSEYQAWQEQLRSIIDYWANCLHPKSFKLQS